MRTGSRKILCNLDKNPNGCDPSGYEDARRSVGSGESNPQDWPTGNPTQPNDVSQFALAEIYGSTGDLESQMVARWRRDREKRRGTGGMARKGGKRPSSPPTRLY